MNQAAWLDDVSALYRTYKDQCERAVSQVPANRLFEAVGPHSIAVLVKHVGGNHRSRWRDFLTSDGEKRDRNRDSEFTTEGDTWESVQALWDAGWKIALQTLDGLGPSDLERTITIRGEPYSVMRAIQRNLNHVVYHAGQIVLLARHFAGDNWQTLSIAPGESEAHNAAMREKYGDWWANEG